MAAKTWTWMRPCRHIVIAALCAGYTCSAGAVTYSIVNGYDNHSCRAVKSVLAKGLVLDAESPICERGFDVSPKAKRLGFTPIERTLLPRSSYPDLILQFLRVVGQEGDSQATTEKKDEKQAAYLLHAFQTEIYTARFDADNIGRLRKTYIFEQQLCTSDNEIPNYVTTYIQKSDGKLDRTWGALGVTEGIPIVYNDHTYYATWQSLKGSVVKGGLAQLDVYDAVPFHPALRSIVPYGGLTTTFCEIDQRAGLE